MSTSPSGIFRTRIRAFRSWSGFADDPARLVRTEPAAILGLALAGAACGITAKVADESQLSWASDLGTYPAAWVLALALIGWFAPGLTHAAWRAATFFASMCLAYYGWAGLFMGFDLDRSLWLWTGIALTVVPALAALTKWASIRRGLLPAAILAAVAALAVADGIVWQLWWAWGGAGAPEGFPLRPFQAFASIAVALTITGACPRDHSTRLLAVALLIPSAILAAGFVDQFMSALFGML